MNKYQEALDRLCENNFFDEKGNCNCDLIVMDCILMQELVDKATPKKPIYKDDLFVSKRHLFCAHCGSRLSNSYNFIDRTMYPYCPYCGGKQDWSDVYNPKPYKFEDLKPDMWVWDVEFKDCIKIKIVFEPCNLYPKGSLKAYHDLNEEQLNFIEFEENRFFPVQMANLRR